jgi:pimeloyl-ACP methyl ester carboxylesterase
MATYVLVHGAWSGAWVYREIADRLRGAGHSVFVAQLTGLGERLHLVNPGITLSTHVDDVVGTIDSEKLDDIILVGHSYGGMVITGVAGARAARIRSLVYLDAFLPKDGQALWDVADEKTREFYIEAQRDTPGLVQPRFGPPGTPPRGLTGHPLLTLLEPVKCGPEADTIANRTYIYATVGTPTIFTQFYDRVKADPAWRVHEIATGHVVMADDPDGLTTLLLAEAER